MTTLVAAMALAIQLIVPMPHSASAAPIASVDITVCHSEPAASSHDDQHGAPSGKPGCDWCVLCGKLGTAVGPLDRVAGLPQRALAPLAIVAVTIDLPHGINRPQTGPVGARAPPDIA